jgi:hypothetical protein
VLLISMLCADENLSFVYSSAGKVCWFNFSIAMLTLGVVQTCPFSMICVGESYEASWAREHAFCLYIMV